MYFAVHSWKPGMPERILATVAQLREQAPEAALYCYALIDGCFDQSLLTAFPWRRYVERSLYDGMRLEGLKLVAPHLVRLRDAPEKQLGWLQGLADACAGKPMISCLISAIPAEALATHFKPYLLAETEDSLEWPVRWADTRVLPGLIAALKPEQRQHFLSPLHAWITADRQGEMIVWQGDGNPCPEPAAFDCWPIDDATFARLVGDAEADAVLGQIDDHKPDLLKSDQPAEHHARVAGQLMVATRYKLEGAPNRLHFAMLGLMFDAAFVEDPAMRSLLEQVRDGGDYQAQVRSLPADFWSKYTRGKQA